MLRVWTWSV